MPVTQTPENQTPATQKLELVLGGTRSGKSRIAQERAAATWLDVVYVATATAQDNEMHERISHHRHSRPQNWQLIEEPLELANTLAFAANRQTCVLVDCLTLWLTNLLCHSNPERLQQERKKLLNTLPRLEGRIIFVSNETGLGVVPADPLSRRFVDEAGRLHQELAQRCHTVIYSVAGLPQVLKGEL